mgnify:CR=1 FL=1
MSAHRIAFQGVLGAYSDLACRAAYPGSATLPCPSFEAAMAALRDGQCDLAMLPCENSLAGRVPDIHRMLPDSGLFVVGEHFQRVEHCLLAPKGASLATLKRAHSHPVALGQVLRLLKDMSLTPVIEADTAGAAALIAERGGVEDAAIASELAAEIYGLEVLVIPTNVPQQRKDLNDLVYLSKEEKFDAIVADVKECMAKGAPVLVAGCGTGSELLEAVAQRPDWQLTALDPSAEMLAEARLKLGDNPRIAWHQSTVEVLLDQPGSAGRQAGALAVLVLQSLPDDGSKLAFLTALARCLQPGAQLVLVDLMQTSLPSLEGQLDQAWRGFQRASGLEDALQEGLYPIGLARLTSLVNAAGFGDPARIFQALGFEGFLLQRLS